jgi:ABC-type transport system involved in cytochrome c biogenesis permease subunit
VAIDFKGLFVDRLKQLCLLTGIVLLLSLAVLCIVGAIMGADWSKWFFTSPTGRGLLGCIGLLIIAGLFEFKDVCRTKWPLAVYPGVLLVLAAGFINCSCTVFAGYIIGCIGLFGLLWTKWSRADIVTAIILLFIIMFIFYSRIVPVPSHSLRSVFFVPHVFAYFLSYVFMARAAFFSFKHLFDRMPETENKSYKFICMGFPFMTAGLVLGSLWAAFAWGDWWGWDPKEMFSLAVWLVFAAFLHFRYLYKQRFLRLNSIWIISGFILIILCLLWVNFSEIFAGLHSYTV